MEGEERLASIEAATRDIGRKVDMLLDRLRKCGTPEEVAMKKLGVSRSTLLRWRKDGRILYERHGRTVLYDDMLEVRGKRWPVPDWAKNHGNPKRSDG